MMTRQRTEQQLLLSSGRFQVLSTAVYVFLIFVLTADAASDSSDDVCYSFGCPFLPRDVFYDEDAKTALQRLKQPTRKGELEEQDNESLALFLSELDSSGDQHKTTMTLCGYKGGTVASQINQDRSILVSPFLHDYQIVGVLDGHGRGGEIVAEYARKEIPIQLAAKLKDLVALEDNNVSLMNLDNAKTEQVQNIIKNVFVNVDKQAPDSSSSGGCTASLALQLGRKLFVANAGDSVTIVAAHRGWNETSTIVYISREDKPHLPDERERIEREGGRVQLPLSSDDSSRVVYKDSKSKREVGLAMSRSIGDWDAPGVTAEPIVDVLDLVDLAETVMEGRLEYDCIRAEMDCGPPDVNFFVVSATDGLLDFVTPQAIVDKMGLAFFGKSSLPDRQSSMAAANAHLAAEELIYLAARGWHEEMQGSYRDDITVSATTVRPWEADSES